MSYNAIRKDYSCGKAVFLAFATTWNSSMPSDTQTEKWSFVPVPARSGIASPGPAVTPSVDTRQRPAELLLYRAGLGRARELLVQPARHAWGSRSWRGSDAPASKGKWFVRWDEQNTGHSLSFTCKEHKVCRIYRVLIYDPIRPNFFHTKSFGRTSTDCSTSSAFYLYPWLYIKWSGAVAISSCNPILKRIFFFYFNNFFTLNGYKMNTVYRGRMHWSKIISEIGRQSVAVQNVQTP